MILNIMKNITVVHFYEDNTAGLKHFKLHSDTTLKRFKKDELISYIHMLYRNWASCDKSYQNLINYVEKIQQK